MSNFIFATSSPRRINILENIKVEFKFISHEFDENNDLNKISETNAKEYKFGRIDSAFINTVFNNCSSRPLRFYLCGPEALIKLSKEHLIGLGINKQDILFELFSTASMSSPISSFTFSTDNDLSLSNFDV